VLFAAAVIALAILFGAVGVLTATVILVALGAVTVAAVISFALDRARWSRWHDLAEQNSFAFTILVLVAILIGGAVQIIPTVVISHAVPQQVAAYNATIAPAGAVVDSVAAEQARWMQQPYSPLELEGRDIFVREGCYVCHSQMIRPFRHEVLRYGDYSRLEESLLDHPFQWGSKRTGLDLARVGGKYANLWHYLHLMDPRSTSPASNMPAYRHFKTAHVNYGHTDDKMATLAKLGVPYPETRRAGARQEALDQAQVIVGDLAAQKVVIAPDSEMAAVIAYLQRLGRGPQWPPQTPVVATEVR
jgi:cytochrome c oxidase cbb3-type subunit I/II